MDCTHSYVYLIVSHIYCDQIPQAVAMGLYRSLLAHSTISGLHELHRVALLHQKQQAVLKEPYRTLLALTVALTVALLR